MAAQTARRAAGGARAGWRGALALVAALLLSTACQADAATGRVQGVVIAVDARSLTRADGFTLRTADGRELTFRVDPSVDWTAGHLREHAALGEPVVVDWRREADGLLAVRLADGEGGRPADAH